MKPRIEIIHSLLKDDGSLWISIDDDEQAYLKILCDEIFGRNNFVNNIIWQKKFSPQNDAKWLSDNHDFIMVYAKNKDKWKPNLLPRTDSMNDRYSNPDNDPRGPWTSSDLSVRTYSKTGDYPIVTPSGRVVNPSASRCWGVSKDVFEELVKDNRIWFGVKGNNIPRRKTFLSEVQDGVVPTTVWSFEEVGSNQDAKKEVKKINPSTPFQTPKPEKLIEKILNISTNEGDIVLDSFLGSGTTIAVANKMKRQWIGVEIGEHVYTDCKKRIDMVINGEKGGISEKIGWQGGGSYKFYELAPTLINIDPFGEPIINKSYNADMLAAAVALHEGCKYTPDKDMFWKQAKASENSYLFVTTRCVTSEFLDTIHVTMTEDEFLVIACKSFVAGADRMYSNIKVKKIPQMLLDHCEFGKDNYNLNIVNPPVYEDDEEVSEDE